MRPVGPEAAEYKAGLSTFHQCCVSLVFLGSPQDLWQNCATLLGGKASRREDDKAQHWDSSQHLALVPEEIPIPQDFGTNIGEYFKLKINQIFKVVTFSEDKEDLELIGRHTRN